MKRILKLIVIFFLFFIASCPKVYAFDIPDVRANNIYFFNLDDNELIYEKNSLQEVQIASLTKMMTVIVSIENVKDYNEKIVVTNDMIKDITLDYSVAGYNVGEVVTYNDLFYGALLPSGADATNILSYSVFSSREEFIDNMNKKAKEIGMTNTHFSNPIGMDEDNYSTAKDMSLLLRYVYKNEKFMEVFTKEEYKSDNNDRLLKGPLKKIHSDSINMNYVLGAKTGFTDMAGLCLASIAKYNEKTYMLVNLGTSKITYYDHMMDSKRIYEYFFNNYDYKKILSKGDTIKKIKTEYDEEYTITSDENVIKYIEKTKNKSDLKYKYDGKKVLTKKIKKGDKIGTYYIYDGEKELYKKDIYSKINVVMPISYFLNKNKYLIIAIFVLFIFLVYKNKKRKIVKNKHR